MLYHLRIHKSRNLRKYQQAAMPGEIPQKAQTAHRKEVQTAHKKEAQTAHRKKTGKHMAFRSLRRPVFYVITGRALPGARRQPPVPFGAIDIRQSVKRAVE